MKPIDTSLNVAVLHMASQILPTGFDVADVAPDNWEDLKALLDAGQRLTVWSGGSEKTIFADREVNFAFRAWHDWTHYRGNFDFSPLGEIMTCEQQIRDLAKVYGGGNSVKRWAPILRCEIIGQALHNALTGEFPDDQRAFYESTREYWEKQPKVLDVHDALRMF